MIFYCWWQLISTGPKVCHFLLKTFFCICDIEFHFGKWGYFARFINIHQNMTGPLPICEIVLDFLNKMNIIMAQRMGNSSKFEMHKQNRSCYVTVR